MLLDAIDDRPGIDDGLLEALADPRRSPVERLHTGLAIVSELVGDAPAVLVFEDLHWADSESAALFERIADQRGPRLLIGTYRPDEVTSRQPVAALLARLERRHAVTHVRLDRLTAAETAAMLAAVTGRPAPVRAAAALHQRTGGNPFFLEELLRGREADDLDELCRAAAAVEPRRGAAPPGRRPRRRRASASSRRPRCSATGSRSTCSPR